MNLGCRLKMMSRPDLVHVPHSYVRPCTSPCHRDPRTPADGHVTEGTQIQC